MKAVIQDKKEIASGTFLVQFSVPNRPDFKPGQHFTIHLFNPPYHDEKGMMRHFSIVNSPNEKGILTMTTRLRDSAFKKSLAEFPLGTEVEIDSITGDFVLPENSNKPLVFIAGGIGITPFMSMLGFAKDENLSHKITLLYSNKDKVGTAFLDELEEMSKTLSGFKLVLTMTEDSEWKGEKGRIDSDFIKRHVDDLENSVFYVAGPPAMVDAIYDALKEAGVDSSRVKSENFTGY